MRSPFESVYWSPKNQTSRNPIVLTTWSNNCLPVVVCWIANSSSASIVVTRTLSCKWEKKIAKFVKKLKCFCLENRKLIKKRLWLTIMKETNSDSFKLDNISCVRVSVCWFQNKAMPSISPNDVKITAFESQTSRQTWISIAWQSLFLALAHIVSADVLQCHSTQTTYSEQFLIKRSQIIHIFTMTNSFPPKKEDVTKS